MAYVFVGISDSQKKAPPLPPTIVSQSDSGSERSFDDGATALTFQDTTFNGKLPILDYTITAVDELGGVVSRTISTLTSTVITGLKSGLKYTYKIKARNLVYSSDDSIGGNTTVSTVPGRVTSAGGTDLQTSGGITVSWIAPSNGGSSITGYIITPNVGAVVDTGNSSTSYTFSGLTVGTGYNFTVAAKNANGTGIASTTSGTVTPTAPAAPVYNAPVYSGGGTPTLPVPTLSVYGTTTDSVTILINNYDANNSYSTTTSRGSGTVSGSLVSVTGLTSSQTVTVYVGASRSGYYTNSNSIDATTSATSVVVGGGYTPTITYGPCVYDGVQTFTNTCGGSGGCNSVTTSSTAGSQVIYSDGVSAGSRACSPSTYSTTGAYSTICCPVVVTPPSASSLTYYCVSLGYQISIYSVCPGTVTPPSTTSTGCAGPCLGTWTYVGGTCICVPRATTPAVTPPATGGSTPPTTVTSPRTSPPLSTPPPPPASNASTCLVSSTLISTPNGFVKAKDIKVGDVVHSIKFAELSTDETVDTIMNWSTGVLTPLELTTSVIKAIVLEQPVDFYLSLNGDLMTPEHPVLVRHNGIYKFMEAGDIHLGYEVLKRTGEALTDLKWVPVTSNEFIEAPDTVYLFDAEEDDVIFTASMLTHNRKYLGGGI